MVAARPGTPSPADTRVPCPVCGGAIHPIAGRCKHCKTDLVAMRGGGDLSPPIALPALGGAAVAAAPPLLMMPAAPEASPFAPAPMAALPIPAQAVAAPPMPGPMPRASGQHASTWSRRWPILVVGIAAVAIVVSIVLLVLPDKTASAARKRRGAPPPAPELDMNREPATPDPWGSAPSITPPGPGQGTQPGTPPGGTGQIDPPVPPPAPGGGGTVTTPTTADQFARALGETLCDRITTCVGGSAPTSTTCRQGMDLFDPRQDCARFDQAKASRCLSTLSSFSCTARGGRSGQVDMQKMAELLISVPACAEACTP